MSLISKIKVNYLEKKVKASQIDGNNTDLSHGNIVSDWLDDFSWAQASTSKPLGDLLGIICSVLDTLLTKVEGKLSSGSFYGVQSVADNGTITYKTGAETPSTSKLYIDVNDGNKLYHYSGSAYVEIGPSSSAS